MKIIFFKLLISNVFKVTDKKLIKEKNHINGFILNVSAGPKKNALAL